MPNELLILKWFGMTELLVKRNKILNLQCEEVQKEDRFLLSEILKAGNLGHYDVRENHVMKVVYLHFFIGLIIHYGCQNIILLKSFGLLLVLFIYP